MAVQVLSIKVARSAAMGRNCGWVGGSDEGDGDRVAVGGLGVERDGTMRNDGMKKGKRRKSRKKRRVSTWKSRM